MSEVNTIQSLVGSYPDKTSIKKSQVYQATHEGTQRSPYYKRAFISFSYGGKWIEDFGFITITNDNKISRPLYADFDDNVTTSEVFDGQIYWDSHYKANQIILPLFTDGVTQQQLEEFKMWFKPGEIRELILAQHPNRAIMARVASVPDTGLLPFEGKEQKKIAGQIIQAKTTMYRGSISIKFTMDDPYWYSLYNVLGIQQLSQARYRLGKWQDANGNLIDINYNNEDIKKIIIEDNIPTIDMVPATDIVVEDNEQHTEHLVVTPDESLILFGANIRANLNLYSASLVESARVNIGRVGNFSQIGISTTTGEVVAIEPTILWPNNDNKQYDIYTYYAGTAPCMPFLQFTMQPGIAQGNPIPYISCPYNNIRAHQYDAVEITFESKHKYVFKFTTPSIWTGYNQALKIMSECITENTIISFEEMRELIRSNVKHYAPRQFAIGVIDKLQQSVQDVESWSSAQTINTYLTTTYNNMRQFLEKSAGSYYPATFRFNSITGEAIGNFTFNKYEKNDNDQLEIVAATSEEDVGDMIKSNYLKLEDRNVPSAEGYVEPWSAEHPEYSYKIYHNATQALQDFKIFYKYKYL